jgi:hypothetical protein
MTKFIMEIMEAKNAKPIEVQITDSKSIVDALTNAKAIYGDVLIGGIKLDSRKLISEIHLDKAAPVAVGDLAGTVVSDTEIQFTHSASDTATWYEYIIVPTTDDLDATAAVRYTIDDLPITIDSLTAETTYDISVRAANSYGGSAYCTVVTKTTEAAA